LRKVKLKIFMNIAKVGYAPQIFQGIFLFLTLVCCPIGHAAELSTFAGGEIDDRGQGYSYIGVDVTQNLNKTIAIAGRVVPSYMTYEYYAGDNLIRANSSCLWTIAGIKLFLDQTMLALLGGAEFRNTTLSPDDEGAKVRGSTVAGLVQGEFDTWFPSRINLNVLASFSGTDHFFHERGRIKKQIANLDFSKSYNLNAGVEQFYGRNEDFEHVGGGLMIELYYIPFKVSLTLRGGYKHGSTFGNGAYGGVELYKAF